MHLLSSYLASERKASEARWDDGVLEVWVQRLCVMLSSCSQDLTQARDWGGFRLPVLHGA